MEKYVKPIMVPEEIEDEVYTSEVATGTAMVSEDATQTINSL